MAAFINTQWAICLQPKQSKAGKKIHNLDMFTPKVISGRKSKNFKIFLVDEVTWYNHLTIYKSTSPLHTQSIPKLSEFSWKPRYLDLKYRIPKM